MSGLSISFASLKTYLPQSGYLVYRSAIKLTVDNNEMFNNIIINIFKILNIILSGVLVSVKISFSTQNRLDNTFEMFNYIVLTFVNGLFANMMAWTLKYENVCSIRTRTRTRVLSKNTICLPILSRQILEK